MLHNESLYKGKCISDILEAQVLQQEMITIKDTNHVSFSRYVTLEMHLEVAFLLMHILLWCFIFFNSEIHLSSLFFKRYSISRKKWVPVHSIDQ